MRLFSLWLLTLASIYAECIQAPLMWIPRDPSADALYRFEQDGKAGYIDQSGRIVIIPRSDLAPNAEFHQGLTPLRGQPGRFLDVQGNIVTTPPTANVEETHPRIQFMEQGVCRPAGECGLKLGCDFTLPGTGAKEVYQNALPFHEGLAAVEQHGLWGFIDETGKVIAPPRFADARSFSGGLARVRLAQDGSWGYLDRSGKIAIAPWFEYADDFAEGLALVGNSDDGFSYIRRDGAEAFPNRFILATRFFKGLAHVQLLDPDGGEDEIFAYIDRSGHTVFSYRRR
jgi:WG containing repeat